MTTGVLPEERTDPSGGTPASRADGDGARSGGRRGLLGRVQALPYALTVPSLVALGLGLGYPLVRLVVMSTQAYGLRQQFGAPPKQIGLENFTDILGDGYFWTVLQRSLVFCLLAVVLTMVAGTAVAVLLGNLGRGMRTALSVSLLLAWATPALTATVVWQWIFDTRHGVVNWALDKLGFDFKGHSWLAEPLSFFFVALLVVVWMGIPFIAFTLHAAMTQIPDEVMEAAAIDGAGPWQRFRDVTWPAIKPIFVVLTALSTMWDLRVFTQVYVLQQAGGISHDTNLLGTWAYREAVSSNRFGKGAAIALVMVAITLLLTVFHLRQMFRQEEIR
jgi:N,N'-diacetylchitobiose transport system permease protein